MTKKNAKTQLAGVICLFVGAIIMLTSLDAMLSSEQAYDSPIVHSIFWLGALAIAVGIYWTESSTSPPDDIV